jgi:hypothetical protein
LWVGVWPLLGVALAQENIAHAIDYAQILLDPEQQPPPEEFSRLLESALQAWNAGKREEASGLLQQVAPLAQQRGYL